ncbi:MAG TPA: ABC transporter permease [Vicinamibacterales bacterium]|nr:ABC transporter permease [Vicinamibacterales bacterium]
MRLPPEREAAIVDEVAQHLEDRYQTLLGSGQPAAEAERRAWRELEGNDVLGHLLSANEPPQRPSLAGLEVAPRGRLLRGLWHDVRYAVRNLRKRSMLSATIIVTLAISLGPTAAVIGMADALFFRPLPVVAAQDRLLHYAFGTPMRDGLIPHAISYANLAEIRDGATTVVGIAGQTSIPYGLALEGVAPRLTLGTAITANYFDVLGVRMIAGRTFRSEEDSAPGGDPVMVLNDGLARALFGEPDAAVGQSVLVNSVPFTVIGVTPADFLGTNASRPSEFWIPGMSYRRANNVEPSRWVYGPNEGPFYNYIVRMAAGASLAQTTAELTARTRALVERDLGSQNRLTIVPILQPGLAAPASLQAVALHAMQLIGAVAGLLVLLGMTNVANLLIFTGLASGRDVAVRKALGASAGRLLQLRLVESILLTLLGALTGVGVAAGLGRLFSDFALPGIGRIEVAIDWRVVLAVACLAVVAGTCAGVAPALLAVRESVTGALGRGIRTGPPRAGRLRHALAGVQVALSLTLLVGALLFLMTLRHLRSVDLGFDPTGVTLVTLNVRGYGYTDARAVEYLKQVADMVRRQPGIQAAGLAFSPPLFGGGLTDGMYLPDQDPSQATNVERNGVSPDYFKAVRLPIVRGRVFTEAETSGNAETDRRPVVVTEALARRLFGSDEAIGRELLTQAGPGKAVAFYVVGIARDSHFRGIERPPDALLYEPIATFPIVQNAYLVVRSTLGSRDAFQVAAEAARRFDPTIPLGPETTFAARIDRQLGQQRLFAWMLGLLGTIGFVLAAVGLHGLIGQTVVERRREFGIRLAIGAAPTGIVKLVLRRAALVLSVGLAAGLALAWSSGRLVESQLFGITSRDPMPYGVAALLMIAVVILASISPAVAATRVDPIEVLRSE